MKARESTLRIVTMTGSALLIMSCLLPGMIPLTPVPTVPAPSMEQNADTLIETLKGQNWVYLQSLAKEQYTEADFAKPGTLTFTVNITDDKPTYFNYGWCTTTEEILKQNFEHIQIKLYFNDKELGSDVVHPITFTRPDGLLCLDFGVMMSDWPNGKYNLEAVATFNEKINDGLADYEAGDYIFIYDVTVEK
ncbi:MAG: hypothetical protein L0287_27330 [Anaerolineae bacterium]|nr:hypothetical protein [Anaerolineae bacterium]MCI0607833.1 hypothetical protein [Anaerolineae bacterium]